MVQTFCFLVGTYIDRRMYPEALAVLDSIPHTPQSNADFKAIYYAYIQLLTGGNGKNSDAAFALYQVEQNQLDVRQTLAESMLAVLQGNSYVRSVKDNSTNWLKKTNKHKHFALYPNPANDLVTIQFYQPLAAKEYLYIYDMTGRLVKTIVINGIGNVQINTGNLYNGVYYLRLGIGNQVEKLVVIH